MLNTQSEAGVTVRDIRAHSFVNDELLNVAAVRRRLGVSDSMVRKLVRTGELAHVRVGKRVLFLEQDIAAYVTARRQPAAGVGAGR